MPKAIDVGKFEQDFIYDLELPMTMWRWRSKVIGPPVIKGVDVDALVIERISLPNGEILGALPSFGAGRTTFFPDFPEVSSINVSFYETETGAANLALMNWQAAVKSQDGWYGLPKDYKCKIYTNLFGYSSNTDPVFGYSCEGVWPVDGGNFELSYDNDERMIIQATFSVDSVIKAPRGFL